jgi:hypothetical protein
MERWEHGISDYLVVPTICFGRWLLGEILTFAGELLIGLMLLITTLLGGRVGEGARGVLCVLYNYTILHLYTLLCYTTILHVHPSIHPTDTPSQPCTILHCDCACLLLSVPSSIYSILYYPPSHSVPSYPILSYPHHLQSPRQSVIMREKKTEQDGMGNTSRGC